MENNPFMFQTTNQIINVTVVGIPIIPKPASYGRVSPISRTIETEVGTTNDQDTQNLLVREQWLHSTPG
jgi:hypothetical protein